MVSGDQRGFGKSLALRTYTKMGGSKQMEKKTKVLLSKLGVDVHNRGVITVANQLKDAGMEVIYIGNALPEEIVKAAIQEDADIVGVSSLGGAHLSLGSEVVEVAKREGLTERVAFFIGGVMAPRDIVELKEKGFDGVFTQGATREEIVSGLKQGVAAKKKG
jgi:methylmalonyl-CoA mutase C-terminal domain/subunit